MPGSGRSGKRRHGGRLPRFWLADGGQILIRDVLVDAARTSPPDGAMFAINMLVNTPGGGTYTFDELSEDLLAAGFSGPSLLHAGTFMDSVIHAARA